MIKCFFMKKKLFISGVFSVGIWLLVLIFFWPNLLERVHLKISDHFHGGIKISDDIVIIGIDNKSLDEQKGLGRQESWDVELYYSKLIDNLKEAKVIGFDIVFANKSKSITNKKLVETIKESKTKGDFFDKIVPYAEYPNPDQEYLAEKLDDERIVIAKTAIVDSNNLVFRNGFLDINTELAVDPLDIYQGKNVHIASINAFRDKDDKVRGWIKGLDQKGIIYENLSVIAAKIFLDSNKINIPLDSENKFKIKFHGGAYSYPVYSFTDVMNDRVDRNIFKNKIVLVARTADTFHDVFYVPTSNGIPMPGVEIHANAIQTILDQDFLRDQSRAMQMLTIFIVALISCIACMYLGIIPSVVYVIAGSFGYYLIAKFSFDKGIIIDMIYSYIAIILAFISIYLYKYFTEMRTKEQIQKLFAGYVNPYIVEKICENPEKVELDGENREITIFFSDIKNFTHISEQLKPEETVNLMSEYFAEMSAIIINNNGVVDKFIGDGIMAFFGAPLDLADHACFACKASLEMQKVLKILNEKWEKEQKPRIEVRIGLNTGKAVVGTIGPRMKMEYTAIGDNVNLASRLEGINKQYGTHLCVSEFTYEKAKDKFEFRKLDKIRVKGKDNPIVIYELIGENLPSQIPPAPFVKGEVRDMFEKALGFYENRDFEKAKESFQSILTSFPNDNPSKIYIERSEKFISNPPNENWDGVWNYEVK